MFETYIVILKSLLVKDSGIAMRVLYEQQSSISS
jgi:hypothetical protein